LNSQKAKQSKQKKKIINKQKSLSPSYFHASFKGIEKKNESTKTPD